MRNDAATLHHLWQICSNTNQPIIGWLLSLIICVHTTLKMSKCSVNVASFFFQLWLKLLTSRGRDMSQWKSIVGIKLRILQKMWFTFCYTFYEYTLLNCEMYPINHGVASETGAWLDITDISLERGITRALNTVDEAWNRPSSKSEWSSICW